MERKRLETWKEIATHFGRGVTTVQRWEATEGLPVHRHQHAKSGTVYAYRDELDAWWAARSTSLDKPDAKAAVRPRLIAFAAALCLGAAVLALWSRWDPAPNRESFQVSSLTSYPGIELHPSFSPKGDQVAFSWNGGRAGNYDIYVKTIGNEPPLRLTTDPAEEYGPAWSPDGRRIAFVRYLSGRRDGIFVVSPSGGAATQIGEMDSRWGTLDFQLAWSPKGEWIVICDRTSQGQAGLFLLSAETGEKRPLTDPPSNSYGDGDPAFSPGGDRLAFSRAIGYDTSDLYVLELSAGYRPAGPPARMTRDKRNNRRPVWSAAGDRLIYSSNRGGMPSLWRVEATPGAEPQPLLVVGDATGGLASSTDGKRLAFAAREVDLNIWSLPAGEEPRPLLVSTRTDRAPAFSPDGSRIAFHSDRTGSHEIWVSNADGSNPVQLTSLGGAYTTHPQWSPDGSQIAFDSRVAGQAEIYTIPAAGGEPVRLTRHPGNDTAPAWSADGQWIYFSSHRGGTEQIWRIPAAGGEPVLMTPNGGDGAAASPDGRFVYYVRGAVLWRIPAGGGVEERVAGEVSHWSNVAISASGIYYVTRSSEVLKYNPADGSTIHSATLDRPAQGAAVSPDGGALLMTLVDEERSDLLLAERR